VATRELAKWQETRESGEKALAEREAVHRKLAAEALERRKAGTSSRLDESVAKRKAARATDALLAGLDSFLASDALDAVLVKGALLTEATPGGLAKFASQEAEGEALVNQLLADDVLM
jgi:ferric-dicitrate binding protein FerR (iron transport regulator)